MSIKIMTNVWAYSQMKGSALLLLLSIADNANDAGLAWPGIEHLASKTRMSDRQVMRLVQTIARSGEITILKGKRYNRYQINVWPPEPQQTIPDKMSGDKMSGSGDIPDAIPDNLSSTPDIAMSPESSLTITSTEPSIKKSTAPTAQPTPLQQMVSAISKVTGIEEGLNYGRLAKEASMLMKAGYSPGTILTTYSIGGAWYTRDWRGKRGELPGTGQIRETVAKLAKVPAGRQERDRQRYADESRCPDCGEYPCVCVIDEDELQWKQLAS